MLPRMAVWHAALEPGFYEPLHIPSELTTMYVYKHFNIQLIMNRYEISNILSQCTMSI